MVKVRLHEVAIASYLFSKVVDFDSSYEELQEAVEERMDLRRHEHRRALLVWLNKWGCRQFTVDQHDLASDQIRSWHEQHLFALPSDDLDLWRSTDADLENAELPYRDLAKRIACVRGSNSFRVSFGPVGAAKILFAIRPRFFLPWDAAIRERLNYDGSPSSYVSFLRDTRRILHDLASACEDNGFSLSDLPTQLGRPQDTLPKLVDKFYWITITRGAEIPSPSIIQKWLDWSRAK